MMPREAIRAAQMAFSLPSATQTWQTREVLCPEVAGIRL